MRGEWADRGIEVGFGGEGDGDNCEKSRTWATRMAQVQEYGNEE